MSNLVSIRLLCEDIAHEKFIQAFLRKKGRFAVRAYPDSYRSHEKGGEKPNNGFVLSNAAKEVKVARKVPPKRALIIVVDGDERGAASRLGHLAQLLKEQEQEALKSGERITTVIPCRNIETWIHHFNGEAVNETDTYSKNKFRIDDAAQSFADFVADGTSPPVPDLPALNAAREELRRLHDLMKQEA